MQELLDGDLSARIFQLLNILDKPPHQQRFSERSHQRLDLALLTFFQAFRKAYVGEHVMHTSKVLSPHPFAPASQSFNLKKTRCLFCISLLKTVTFCCPPTPDDVQRPTRGKHVMHTSKVLSPHPFAPALQPFKRKKTKFLFWISMLKTVKVCYPLPAPPPLPGSSAEAYKGKHVMHTSKVFKHC